MNFWKDRNVFVTGCTGFLGFWLSRYLIEKDANVVGLVRDYVPKSHLIWSGIKNDIVSISGEVEDYTLLERCLNEYEIDTVFHLAAQTIVTIANRNPISTFKSNINGTWNILEACRRAPLISRVVIASSDKAYGQQGDLPYDEKMPLRGAHPYDVSKSCADLLSSSYYHTYALPVCVTRCGNFYGGGDLNFSRVVPGTIKSVLREQRPLIRSDGSYLRDYLYIKDAATSYALLAEKMDDKSIHGEAFNFSTEQPMTVLEVVKKILQVMKSELNPIILNESTNEITKQYLSAAKARRLLKWHPIYSFEEGLAETVSWYRSFFAGDRTKT
ncbi:MAG: GDP-mannose 4,6-dehydratase [Halobacteriota archaeon]